MQDFTEDLRRLRGRLAEAEAYLRVAALRGRRPQLEAESSRPDLWDQPERARAVTSELAALSEDLDLYDRLAADLSDAETLHELAVEEDDPSVEAEIAGSVKAIGARFDELELRSLFPGSSMSATRCARSSRERGAPTPRTGPRCCCACTVAGPSAAAS